MKAYNKVMYSKKLALLYDRLMGDYSSISEVTKKLVWTYLPKQSSILEIGCGTGNMLSLFKDDYILSGLDNAPAMLKIGKQKVPQATFFQADMTSFDLNQRFDGILCIFDTINHLDSISQIRKMLKRVKKHLNKNGIFIVDMNTPVRMERLAQLGAYIGKLDKQTLEKTVIVKKGKNRYAVQFEIFENVCSKSVSYFTESVPETVYDAQVMQELLQQYFVVKGKLDPIRKRISSKTGRIFFVCQKK
jgi:ubiquinone/menaquinone biosynthesis C-methylase UbiE